MGLPSQPGQGPDADELLQITGQGLDYFDATYDFAYPWGSYDCVLVPRVQHWRHENPGCVTSLRTPTYSREATAVTPHALTLCCTK